MTVRDDHPADIVRPLVTLLANLIRDRSEPVVVALDGRSGSGKSTAAAAVAEAMGTGGDARPVVSVIEGDLFYGGGSSAAWDRRSAQAKVDRVIDWRRQRQVLTSLRRHGEAAWRPFDWDDPNWDADEPPLAPDLVRIEATAVVLLEGAYSARPELSDLLDLRVLLEVPTEVRRARLTEREGDDYRQDWEQRWSEAEDLYFGSIVPADLFDLVL